MKLPFWGPLCALVVTLLLCPLSVRADRSASSSPEQAPFALACSTLPFQAIHKPRQIDTNCGVAGNADLTSEADHAPELREEQLLRDRPQHPDDEVYVHASDPGRRRQPRDLSAVASGSRCPRTERC